jgi:tRNA A-37 threonylcarbamoyl transferase component Bud32
MKYPRLISSGANNKVIALSETEVAKIFTGDTRSDIGSEAEKMKYANAINGLVVQFIRLDYDETLQADMLIMERIYPLDYRAYEVEKRELWWNIFEDELSELHKAGFVHHDIRRPSSQEGMAFDNVLLTDKGLRLIDVGISALKKQVGEKLFSKYVEIEKAKMSLLREYFLNR